MRTYPTQSPQNKSSMASKSSFIYMSFINYNFPELRGYVRSSHKGDIFYNGFLFNVHLLELEH